jgi:hypothetical protein
MFEDTMKETPVEALAKGDNSLGSYLMPCFLS